MQDPQKQRVIFFPVAFPRVLFANLLAVSISTFPDALLAWYGPMLGIDIDHVDEDKNAEPAWMGYPGMALFALTMYECQRCVAAREKIEDDYRGQARRLCDCVRCSVIVNSEAQLIAVAQALEDSAAAPDGVEFKVVKLKNRFKEPLYNGYRDALYSIRVRVHLAVAPRYQGAGSSRINAYRIDTPLEAIRQASAG